MSEPQVSTLIATQWRHEVAEHLKDMLGLVSLGTGLVGSPEVDGVESEMTNPYAVMVALLGPDGVVVSSHGLRYDTDVRRIEHAVHDALHPDEVARRVAWEKEQQAKVDAYEALAFPCERGGHCTDRFATDRGRRTHYAAADRQRARGQDWLHQGEPHTAPVPRPPSFQVVANASEIEP